MDYFGRFYLDKEKDLIITLFLSGHQMSYLLTTPNHKTGNLITNLARLCQLKLSYDSHGFKIIKGKVPAIMMATIKRFISFALPGSRLRISILMAGSRERLIFPLSLRH